MKLYKHFITTLQYQGLSSEEAAEKLKSIGPNILPSDKKRNFLSITFSTLLEPMPLLLLTAGSIYMLQEA